MDFYSLMDRIKGNQPGTTKSVKGLNKIHMSPAAKKAAVGKAQALSVPKGTGWGMSVAGLIPQQAYDRVANEIVRGAVTVLGGDTTLMDARISGKPLVKSVGSTDFNVATNEGMAAYKKALNATKTDDPKRTIGGGLDTGDGKVKERPPGEVTTYGNFQEQQAALMGSLGVTTSPFSSTQLPTTSDSLYTQFPTGDNVPDFGVDSSKVLANIDDSTISDLYKNSDQGSTFRITQDEAYSSPVNFDIGPGAVEPMLNPEVNSMTAMRIKDRNLGLMYASGQFFAEGKDGKPVLVNRELAKDVRRGKEGAQDQLAAYLAGDGIKPQGGVISNPPRELMVPPKAEETEITSVPGEFKPAMPEIGSYTDQSLGNIGDSFSKLVEEDIPMPDFSRKLGLNFGTQPNTGMYAIDPEVFKYVSRDAYNSNVM